MSDLSGQPARLPRLDSVALLEDALALTAAARAALRAAAARPGFRRAHQRRTASGGLRGNSSRAVRARAANRVSVRPAAVALPSSLSSFVGREREMEELAVLLEHRRGW